MTFSDGVGERRYRSLRLGLRSGLRQSGAQVSDGETVAYLGHPARLVCGCFGGGEGPGEKSVLWLVGECG